MRWKWRHWFGKRSAAEQMRLSLSCFPIAGDSSGRDATHARAVKVSAIGVFSCPSPMLLSSVCVLAAQNCNLFGPYCTM